MRSGLTMMSRFVGVVGGRKQWMQSSAKSEG